MAKYQDLIAPEDGLLAITGRAWLLQGDATRPHPPLSDDPQRGATTARQLPSALDSKVAAQVKPGDFIVAGSAFETEAAQRDGPVALKALGVAAVIARSFGGSFLRNATNIGLPALVITECLRSDPCEPLESDLRGVQPTLWFRALKTVPQVVFPT